MDGNRYGLYHSRYPVHGRRLVLVILVQLRFIEFKKFNIVRGDTA